jgi:hypothetical protein
MGALAQRGRGSLFSQPCTSNKSRWMDLTHWGSETFRRFLYERDAGLDHPCLRDCQNLLPTSLSSFSRLPRVTREHL